MKRRSLIFKKGLTKKPKMSEQKKKMDMSDGEPVHEECVPIMMLLLTMRNTEFIRAMIVMMTF